MISCFLEVGLYDRDEDIYVPKKFYRKFKKVYKNYLVNKSIGELKEVNYLNHKGYTLKLPITEEWIKRLNEREVKKLIDRNLAILPEDITISYFDERILFKKEFDYPQVHKDHLNLLLLPLLIKEISKYINVDMKYLKVALICDDDKLSMFTLNVLYPELNYLTIITEKTKKMIPRIEYIFNDTGLYPILNDRKNCTIINSHIVINTSESNDKIFYNFSKSLVFIDLVKNQHLKNDIAIKRQDITIIDNFSIKIDEQRIRKEIFEMILYIVHGRYMRKYIFNNFRSIRVDKLKDIIEKYNVTVDRLYFGNQLVKRQKLKDIK